MTPERAARLEASGAATERVETIDGYLERLRAELAGSDPALVQDALGSAEEYLRSEQAELAARGESIAEAELVQRTLERFGTPREVAEAYRDSERRRLQPGPFPVPERRRDDLFWQIFGVVVDPRAYGALLYMFLALATGVLSFTWAVTGLALSIGLLPLIIGVFVPILFLASLRGFAVLEGRIVEALLGVRMPRRGPAPAPGRLLARAKGWLKDGRTWSTLLYMLLQMPLGILYFTLFTVILSLTLGIALAPIAQAVLGVPTILIGRYSVELSLAMLPLVWIAAAFDLLLALHLARALGRLHGRYAKAMLVRP
ncbi:MAG TPA: sensor domain-containing protein [Thermoanaerobaculia bacterium]|nr:sensor domain-containing protein [Thermoanaerobaculia bacterium]